MQLIIVNTEGTIINVNYRSFGVFYIDDMKTLAGYLKKLKESVHRNSIAKMSMKFNIMHGIKPICRIKYYYYLFM